jgi:hypothetical protein
MIEFLSNFYLKNKFENDVIPKDAVVYTVNSTNVEEIIKKIITDYKNLKSVIIIYYCNEDIRYFLSIFTRQYCNIKSRSEFEDVLLMNSAIFL